MSPRQLARLSFALGFAGFFGLLFVWAIQGGQKGSDVYALAAFAWVGVVLLWQQYALRCPACQRDVFENHDLPWPIPAKCGGCGRKL